jgi:hypothetical protein
MNPEDPQEKATAHERFARWLVGEGPSGTESPELPADPDALVNDALAELEPHQALLDECGQISSSLPDYVALGSMAAERMPVVREHLDRCKHCAASLRVLVRVREDLAAWHTLAATAGKPAPRLVLAGNTWKWLAAAGRRLVPLSREDLALGRRVAGWQLQQRSAGVLAFQQTQEPLLHLTLAAPLEEARAQLRLQVMPEFLPTVHGVVWRARLEMDRGATIHRIRVGLGNEQRATKGWRTLGPEKPVEFQVEAPGDSSYWLHLEWSDRSGELVRKQLEIPLGSGAEDTV